MYNCIWYCLRSSKNFFFIGNVYLLVTGNNVLIGHENCLNVHFILFVIDDNRTEAILSPLMPVRNIKESTLERDLLLSHKVFFEENQF